jgi:REP element-mobilizing transposase RayT
MSVFYDPYSPKDVHERNLPHWCQDGRLHFVTFRLADSIPRPRLLELEFERRSWQDSHRGPANDFDRLEYLRLFCDRVEGWLDDNVGACQLARNDCADTVQGSLMHFDGQRYRVDHWVVMPNHVHVLVAPLNDVSLTDILHGWKSFTSRRINSLCDRTGQLWQHESFDHIVRSESQLAKLRNYIISNASAAKGRARLSTARIV